jgi:hypothetical protein
MNVAGTLIPRHVLFSDNWATKTPDLVSEKTVAEEAEFTGNFPHLQPILEIFRLAGLDYGRIDYGLCNGRIQVWEINTNPTIVPRREKIDPRRMSIQSESARRIIETLLTLSGRRKSVSAHPFRSKNFFALKTLRLFQWRRKHP